jgi:TonB family protein
LPTPRRIFGILIALSLPLLQAQTGSTWLDEVSYIITAPEKAAFKNLQTDNERERFIEQFWEQRNPTPGAAGNPFKEEYYRRIAYSNERFSNDLPGWKTDRGRVYITYGPPDEIEQHASAEPPVEVWRYHHLEGVGDNVDFGFADRKGNGNYSLRTHPPTVQHSEFSVASPQTVEPGQRIRAGGGVQAENLISKVDPIYPALALQARIQGTVRFAIIVGKDGHVLNAKVVSGHPLLVRAAKEAIEQWVYRPTLLNGQPIEVQSQADVNFTLPRP